MEVGKEDIPHLVRHFLEKAAQSLGKKKIRLPRELFTLLAAYHFPGNIRDRSRAEGRPGTLGP